MSRFPFLPISDKSLGLFDKIHIDLLGLTSMNYVHGYQFYASVVDDFSRYIWLVPLKRKSDFFRAFYMFHKYVHTQFEK